MASRDPDRLLAVGGLACALVLGTIVRLSYVWPVDFPLNDGGLFYAMVEDLLHAHYALPAYTSYNAAGIPFAYPPLGLYLAALLADWSPWSLLDVFRFLPLVLNLLTIVAFFLLARVLLPGGAGPVFAVIAFALLPRSFAWLVMGGGVTRALGFLFALLALRQVYLMYTRGGTSTVVWATLLCACTVLGHLEMGWFVAYSSALFWLARGRSRGGVARSTVVAVGTCALTAPWWATVMARHGPATLLGAGDSVWGLNGLFWLLTLTLTEESFFPLWEALALVGVLACLATRRLLLPAWLVAMFLLDARSALTTATVPLALLASIGITDALLPFLHGAARAGAKAADDPAHHLLGNRLATYTLAFLLLYATLAAQMGRSAFLAGLAPDEREAMGWIAAHAAPASAVLAITAEPSWARDRVAEWLPVLAARPSVATVQGYEWLGKQAFDARRDNNVHAQRCAYEGADCLEAWARETGLPFALVYVSRHAAPSMSTAMAVDDCCSSLRASLGADPRYQVVYDGPGAAVYRRLTPGAGG